ncbi:MAG TPA: ACP phosphodiesterase [Cyclobacteriaceae bacterium]|nr:ACP phosphodiesterase [Cyclobacteriaceae bacterium]
MNFLAHAFLSFNEPKVLVGNLIGDFVRGDVSDRFDREIVWGVQLHRDIDVFTDSHPAVKDAQKILKPTFGLYSLVITDMYFDFFLCKGWDNYCHQPIEEFSAHVYEVLELHYGVLPRSFRPIFKNMKRQDWLANYGTLEAMKAGLTSLSTRATFDSKMETAHLVLEERQEDFKASFEKFFPELIVFSRQRLNEMFSEK